MPVDWSRLSSMVSDEEQASTVPEKNLGDRLVFPSYTPTPEQIRAQELERVKAEGQELGVDVHQRAGSDQWLIGEGWRSGRTQASINDAISKAQNAGDYDSVKKLTEFSQKAAQFAYEKSPEETDSFLERGLKQLGESGPLMAKMLTARIGQDLALAGAEKIAESQARKQLAKVGASAFFDVIKSAGSKAAARQAVILKAGQMGPQIGTLADEAVLSAANVAMFAWDVVKALRTGGRLMSIPRSIIPIASVKDEFKGAFIADEVRGGRNPEDIPDSISESVGILQAAVENFAVINPVNMIATQAEKRILGEAVKLGSRNMMRSLGKYAARTGIQGVVELSEEFWQPLVARYGSSVIDTAVEKQLLDDVIKAVQLTDAPSMDMVVASLSEMKEAIPGVTLMTLLGGAPGAISVASQTKNANAEATKLHETLGMDQAAQDKLFKTVSEQVQKGEYRVEGRPIENPTQAYLNELKTLSEAKERAIQKGIADDQAKAEIEAEKRTSSVKAGLQTILDDPSLTPRDLDAKLEELAVQNGFKNVDEDGKPVSAWKEVVKEVFGDVDPSNAARGAKVKIEAVNAVEARMQQYAESILDPKQREAFLNNAEERKSVVKEVLNEKADENTPSFKEQGVTKDDFKTWVKTEETREERIAKINSEFQEAQKKQEVEVAAAQAKKEADQKLDAEGFTRATIKATGDAFVQDGDTRTPIKILGVMSRGKNPMMRVEGRAEGVPLSEIIVPKPKELETVTMEDGSKYKRAEDGVSWRPIDPVTDKPLAKVFVRNKGSNADLHAKIEAQLAGKLPTTEEAKAGAEVLEKAEAANAPIELKREPAVQMEKTLDEMTPAERLAALTGAATPEQLTPSVKSEAKVEEKVETPTATEVPTTEAPAPAPTEATIPDRNGNSQTFRMGEDVYLKDGTKGKVVEITSTSGKKGEKKPQVKVLRDGATESENVFGGLPWQSQDTWNKEAAELRERIEKIKDADAKDEQNVLFPERKKGNAKSIYPLAAALNMDVKVLRDTLRQAGFVVSSRGAQFRRGNVQKLDNIASTQTTEGSTDADAMPSEEKIEILEALIGIKKLAEKYKQKGKDDKAFNRGSFTDEDQKRQESLANVLLDYAQTEEFKSYQNMSLDDLNKTLDSVRGRTQTRSTTEGQPATRQNVTQFLVNLAEKLGGSFTRQATQTGDVGILRIGRLQVRVVIGKGGRTAAGEVAAGRIQTGTAGDYLITIDEKNGNMTTIEHEFEHIVWDSMTPPQKSMASRALGYDITERGPNGERIGEERFVTELQTEEGRRSVAERILKANPADRSLLVRMINKISQFLLGIDIIPPKATQDAQSLAQGLKDFSLLVQPARGEQMATRDQAGFTPPTTIEEAIRYANRGDMDSATDVLYNYKKSLGNWDYMTREQRQAWMRADNLFKQINRGEYVNPDAGVDDRTQTAPNAQREVPFSKFAQDNKTNGKWSTDLGKEFNSAYKEARKEDNLLTLPEFYRDWIKTVDVTSFAEAQDLRDSVITRRPGVNIPEQERRRDVWSRLKAWKRDAIQHHTMNIYNLSRAISPQLGEYVRQNLHPEVAATVKNRAMTIMDEKILGRKIETDADMKEAAKKTTDLIERIKSAPDIKSDLGGLFAAREYTKSEYYDILTSMLEKDNRRALYKGFTVGKNNVVHRTSVPWESFNTRAEAFAKAELAKDPDLRAMADTQKEIFDSIFPQVNEVYKRITPKSEWDTETGLRKVDFYKAIKHDSILNTDAKTRGKMVHVLKNISAAKEREGSGRGLLIGDGLMSIFNSVDMSSQYIANAEFTAKMRRMLKQEQSTGDDGTPRSLGEAIGRTMGSNTVDNFLEMVDQMDGATYYTNDQANQVTKSMMRWIARAGLTGPTTVMMQGAAMFIPMVKYNANTISRGYLNASGISLDEMISMARKSDHGGALITRLSHAIPYEEFQNLKYSETQNKLIRGGQKVVRQLDKVGFWAVKGADRFTVIRHGRIAWEYINETMPNATQEQKAEAFVKEWNSLLEWQMMGDPAMRVMSHNQGGWGPVLNMFRTTINAQYLKLAESYMVARDSKNPEQMREFFTRATMTAFSMTAYITFARMLGDAGKEFFTDLFGDDEDKKDSEKRTKYVAENRAKVLMKEFLSNIAAQAPITTLGASVVDAMTEMALLDRKQREQMMETSGGRLHPMTAAYSAIVRSFGAINQYANAVADYEETQSKADYRRVKRAHRELYKSTLELTRYSPISTPIPIWSNFLSLDKALFNLGDNQ